MGTVICIESRVFWFPIHIPDSRDENPGDVTRDSAWQLGSWRTFRGDKIKHTVRENVVYCVKSANFVFKFTQVWIPVVQLSTSFVNFWKASHPEAPHLRDRVFEELGHVCKVTEPASHEV